jgi:hypothetical protein
MPPDRRTSTAARPVLRTPPHPPVPPAWAPHGFIRKDAPVSSGVQFYFGFPAAQTAAPFAMAPASWT